ncbi:MAG: SDR family NAD(P)-dependent oxidoreductase [Bacteroidia bacterium]
MKIIITGAVGGIAQATVKLLLQKTQAHLVLTDYDVSLLEATYSPHARYTLHKLDVRELSDWDSLWQEEGITHLIQMAGVMRVGSLEVQSLEEWTLQRSVNLDGVILGTVSGARYFLQRGGGHIINIASLAGVAPIAGISFYTATKFGVRGFTLAADMELRSKGVALTVVCPGPVWTPLFWNEVKKEEAYYTLSAGGVLAPQAVAQAIYRALRKKPQEIALPAGKAFLARIASFLPNFTPLLARGLLGAAKKRQAQLAQKVST